MIRSATKEDIEEILKITKSCAAHMIEKDIFQWNEYYPNEQAFLKDVARNELYVLEKGETVIGSITISTIMDEEYVPISWLTPNSKNVYIHRLAISPNFQSKGFAQKLMDFAESYAKENNYVSVRLDTFSKNERNQKFYEQRGYKKLGEIYFPKQSEHPFYCYELVF